MPTQIWEWDMVFCSGLYNINSIFNAVPTVESVISVVIHEPVKAQMGFYIASWVWQLESLKQILGPILTVFCCSCGTQQQKHTGSGLDGDIPEYKYSCDWMVEVTAVLLWWLGDMRGKTLGRKSYFAQLGEIGGKHQPSLISSEKGDKIIQTRSNLEELL